MSRLGQYFSLSPGERAGVMANVVDIHGRPSLSQKLSFEFLFQGISDLLGSAIPIVFVTPLPLSQIIIGARQPARLSCGIDFLSELNAQIELNIVRFIPGFDL